jgi:hypothetical protein
MNQTAFVGVPLPFFLFSFVQFVPFVPSLRAKRSNPVGERDCFTGEQFEASAGLLRRFAPRNDAFLLWSCRNSRAAAPRERDCFPLPAARGEVGLRSNPGE